MNLEFSGAALVLVLPGRSPVDLFPSHCGKRLTKQQDTVLFIKWRGEG